MFQEKMERNQSKEWPIFNKKKLKASVDFGFLDKLLPFVIQEDYFWSLKNSTAYLRIHYPQHSFYPTCRGVCFLLEAHVKPLTFKTKVTTRVVYQTTSGNIV